MIKLEAILCLLTILVGIYLLAQERATNSDPHTAMTPATESHVEQYTVYLDPAFTAEQVLQAESALAEWETAPLVNGPRFTIIRKSVICNAINCPHSIAIHPDTQQHITQALNRQGLRGDYLGATYMVGRWGSNVYVATNLPLDTQKYVWLHEIGHTLGLDHTNDKPSIMCQVKQCLTGKITTADIEQYNSLHMK